MTANVSTLGSQVFDGDSIGGAALRPKGAGPEFFATNPVSQLMAWPQDSLSRLGSLSFPMRYDPASDRYSATTWTSALAEIGLAISRARQVTLTGSHRFNEELQALQLILSSHVRAQVDLLDSNENCRLESTGPSMQIAPRRTTDILIVFGELCGAFAEKVTESTLMVYLCENVRTEMFAMPNNAVALPISSSGWRLSHVAFHRLLDIEAEQSRSYMYGELFENGQGQSRPICFVTTQILRFIKLSHQARKIAT
ncbi:hypothetical protein [Pararhizobium arenae]|uniref:hypothetical protein n=1 Tax=Pararhizobium arenae TaxID=1856850 RepID=UPI00094B58D1|nr:hypothetical protein [Pararhizobium arenae]